MVKNKSNNNKLTSGQGVASGTVKTRNSQVNMKPVANEPKKREKQTNALFSLNDEIQNLFGANLINVMQKVQEFMPRYKKVKDQNQRKMLMLEFIINFMFNDASK